MTQVSFQAQSAPKKRKENRISLREIASLTWPQILMMLFQFCIGITDVTVAGHIHADIQAAFGYITQTLFVLLVVGIALNNGGVAAMSQSLGAKLVLRATRYVGLLLKLGFCFCVVVMLLAYFGRDAIMTLLQVPEAVRDTTVTLWSVYLFIIPAQFFTSLCMAVFRSRKEVKIPLMVVSVVCILNIIGDLTLGLGMFGAPKMGGMGIVVAGLIAVYAGALVNIFFLVRKKIIQRSSFGPWRWEKKAFPYVLKIALPAGGLQVLWQLGFLVLFAITSRLPESISAVAGLTVGLRIEGLMFLPTMGFSATASILVGHCLGAGDRDEAKTVAVKVVGAGVLCMMSTGTLLWFFIPEISDFVAQDPSVRAVAGVYLKYNILAAPFTGVSMIVAGIMTGAGANVYTLVIYSLATWCVRLPLAWYLGHHILHNVSGVFIAMLVSQIVQASTAMFVLLRCDWYRFASTAKRFTRGK